MFFKEGKQYEGYLFAALPPGAASLNISVALETASLSPLASQSLNLRTVDATGQLVFQRLNFTLIPRIETTCRTVQGINDVDSVHCGATAPPGEDQKGHSCIKCEGQFSVTLNQPGTVFLAYAFLQPGSWGRLGDLPVNKGASDTLLKMGVSLMRQGGSFVSVHNPDSKSPNSMSPFRWQDWTGPPWSRPSRGATWGQALIEGWGPFEAIDMCNELDIEPVISVGMESSPADMADLIEYCWGETTTTMGKKRELDFPGHTAPFRVRYFELGNEQNNPNYLEQVAAMEKKAKVLGMGRELFYLYPGNEFPNDDNFSTNVTLFQPRIDEHLLADIHMPTWDAPGGALEKARSNLRTHPNLRLSYANAETNLRTHNMDRALREAADMNDWLNIPAELRGRLSFRAASFCLGAANDRGADHYDQALAFFLPNKTWLQPPGYAHQMISTTWQPIGVNVTVTGTLPPTFTNGQGIKSPASRQYVFPNNTASAQQSQDGSRIVVRLVNVGSDPGRFRMEFLDCHNQEVNLGPLTFVANITTLAAVDANATNSVWQPEKVSPKASTPMVFHNGDSISVPGNSFTIVELVNAPMP